MESRNRWIYRLKYDERELMCAGRFAVVVFLSEAHKRNVLRSSSSSEAPVNAG